MTDTPTPKPSGSPTPSAGGFDANRPTIISLLYLGSFITGISGLVGIVLAHVWSGEEQEPWLASHYTYLIRTFWIGFVASIIGVVLSIVLIGIPLLMATAVWVGVRSIMSLIKAQKQEPMPDPETFLI
ncbi:MAG: DUF4870 domain-containing protein [Erythrobacter sp.]